jgi:hypothetical protein
MANSTSFPAQRPRRHSQPSVARAPSKDARSKSAARGVFKALNLAIIRNATERARKDAVGIWPTRERCAALKDAIGVVSRAHPALSGSGVACGDAPRPRAATTWSADQCVMRSELRERRGDSCNAGPDARIGAA